MGVLLVLCFAGLTLCSASKSYHHPPKSIKCYQCAYSAPNTRLEKFQVSKTVYDTVEVPRTVYDEVSISRLVYDDVPVTRLEYYDVEVPAVVYEEVVVPKVVTLTREEPRVITEYAPAPKSKKSGYYSHYEEQPIPVTRTVYETVTYTALEDEVKTVPKTVINVEQRSHVVKDTKQVSRIVFDTKQVSRTVVDTKQVPRTAYETRNRTITVPGGWEKCANAFTHDEALAAGIDVWDGCHDNCYARKEGDNLFRGCYKGEFAVDPNQLGCHVQNGALWCFCAGDLCNNMAPVVGH